MPNGSQPIHAVRGVCGMGRYQVSGEDRVGGDRHRLLRRHCLQLSFHRLRVKCELQTVSAEEAMLAEPMPIGSRPISTEGNMVHVVQVIRAGPEVGTIGLSD